MKLQLCDLCDQKSDEQILAVLDDLPQDLPQTFGRVLRRYAKRNDIDVGRQIFRWATVAKRPLTLAELRETLATEPLQEDWKAERQMNEMKKAVACCGNLIFIDEEDQTVHFTHSSVKQYLLSDAVDDSLQAYKIDIEEADAEIGAVCVTYLNFSVFKGRRAKRDSVKTQIEGRWFPLLSHLSREDSVLHIMITILSSKENKTNCFLLRYKSPNGFLRHKYRTTHSHSIL